jgi:hypothetical protein
MALTEKDFYRILRKKEDENAALKKELKADRAVEKTTIEKGLWALCFTLVEKYVVCPKCEKTNAKPWAAKSGYILCRCQSCGEIFDQNKSKSATFNAYFDDIKRMINE